MADPLLLLVDDDPMVLTALKRLAMRSGYVVRTATEPEQALGCLEDVGVVVADLMMPGLDGIEFLRRVRKEKPLTTRYLLTGTTACVGLATAVSDGSVSAVLYKPWDERMMLHAIRRGFDIHALRFGMRSGVTAIERRNFALPVYDDYGI